MATLMESPVARGNPTDRYCGACGVILHSYQGHQSCEQCGKVFCQSCGALNRKLTGVPGGRPGDCKGCSLLLQLKKEDRDSALAQREKELPKPPNKVVEKPFSHTEVNGKEGPSNTQAPGEQTHDESFSSSEDYLPCSSSGSGGNTTPYKRHASGKGDDSYDTFGLSPEDLLEGDINDLEDVPAFDEIPFAMFLAGEVDRKTVMRSQIRKMQEKALQNVPSHSVTGQLPFKPTPKTRPEDKNKNKNKNVGITKRQVKSEAKKPQEPQVRVEGIGEISNVHHSGSKQLHVDSPPQAQSPFSQLEKANPPECGPTVWSPMSEERKSDSQHVNQTSNQTHISPSSTDLKPDMESSGQSVEINKNKNDTAPKGKAPPPDQKQVQQATEHPDAWAPADKSRSETPHDGEEEQLPYLMRMQRKQQAGKNTGTKAGRKTTTPSKSAATAMAYKESATDNDMPYAMRLSMMSKLENEEQSDYGTSGYYGNSSRTGSLMSTLSGMLGAPRDTESTSEEPLTLLVLLRPHEQGAESSRSRSTGGPTIREIGDNEDLRALCDKPVKGGNSNYPRPLSDKPLKGGNSSKLLPDTPTKGSYSSGPGEQPKRSPATAVTNGSTVPVKEVVATKVNSSEADKTSLKTTKPGEGGSTQDMSKAGETSPISIAEKRHRAFKKVRFRNSDSSQLKCSACGRPECEGHIMQKMREMRQGAKENGLEVRDVVPDGNCMFAAVVDQLQMFGENQFTHQSLREAAVAWLLDNPCSEDGTPFSRFLEEEWDVYLTRMMKDGQWGDHIILKAVVEVVQHPILVLNASSTDSRMNKFEPRNFDPEKSNDSLILGHVGEFHYTSLRPAVFQESVDDTSERTSSITDENSVMDTEGLEDLSMFEETYVDPDSDMPAAHFSFLLKKLLPITLLEKASSSKSTTYSKPELQTRAGSLGQSSEYYTKQEYAGPLAEGVYVPSVESRLDDATGIPFDWAIVTVIDVWCNSRVVEKDDPERLPTDFLLEEAGAAPGHAFINEKNTSSWYGTVTRNVPHAFGRCANERRINHSEADRRARNACVGKTMPMQLMFTEAEIAFPLVSWPKSAESWLSRDRAEGWPERSIIESVKSEGCLLFPEPSRNSTSPDTEWKLSYALVEKKLLDEAVSPNQKHTYIVFRTLCNQQFKASDQVTDEHYKTVFFYACERIPAEFWSSSPGACIFYMMDHLLNGLKERQLAHYFNPNYNLLGLLGAREGQSLASDLLLVRSQPLLFLRQIFENTKYVTQGNMVLDRIQDDIEHFKSHRNLRQTTLEVFVPLSLDVARDHIKHGYYRDGYEAVSQAFEERLAVSTCDDTVPFSIFLNGAVNGLNFGDLVWFCVYADKHLQGQLQVSLSTELCSDVPLRRIQDVIPKEITAGYGESQVPKAFSMSLCAFCNDFAVFLFMLGSYSAALPVLNFCREKYKQKLQQGSGLSAFQMQASLGGFEEDFSDIQMFSIYIGLYVTYSHLQQKDAFQDIMGEVETLCDRIGHSESYSWLLMLWRHFKDSDKVQMAQAKMASVASKSEDEFVRQRLKSALSWRQICY